MTDEFYFFDSYAIIEILEGNKRLDPYKDACIITTRLNLFEVFYFILRQGREKEYPNFLEEYNKFTAHFDVDIISKAVKLKHAFKKRGLSMTDCIGYILAKQLRIKFLTGDREFRDLENVEFVK